MLILALLLLSGLAHAADPISLDATNPHFYSFRGKPTVLVTSGEHYGAVLNGEFNYLKYLDTLKKDRLNLTRIFSGVYREAPGDFGISRNTLAPSDARYIAPYARAAQGAKFDLKRWNPLYWDRLKKFVEAASARGIVVEYTFFCAWYNDRMWELSPLNARNNVNGVGDLPRADVNTLKNAALVATEEEFVKKAIRELSGYDNVIFEVVNEPYNTTSVPDDWQRHFAQVAHDTAPRHLIAQNVANITAKVTDPDPNISVFNFHYARPPVAVAQNYSLKRVIGLDETGFDGTLDAIYRFQAWDFLMAGGAHYNNLDYSFAVGYEDGTFPVPGSSPGGGSAELRKQLGYLASFFANLDFVKMTPAPESVIGGLPEEFTARALAKAPDAYAVYLHSGRVAQNYRPRYSYLPGNQSFAIALNLPAGRWTAEWSHPRVGKAEPAATFEHSGGHAWVSTPEFAEDIVLLLTKK